MNASEPSSPTPPPSGLVAVIPCFNAGERVGEVLRQTRPLVSRLILVDDGSTDGCLDGRDLTGVELVRFPENRGKGHALLAGLRRALEHDGPSAVVLLDADGQHVPQELTRLYEVFIKERADLVIGERRFGQQQVPWRSRFGNRVTAAVTEWIFGRRLPDTQCGFRLLSPHFAELFTKQATGGRYETEMQMILFAVAGGCRIAFAPISTVYEAGNSSSHFHKVRDSVRIYRVLARYWLRRTDTAQ